MIEFGTACQACHTRGVNRKGEACLRCSGSGIEPPAHGFARRTDPETSHQAAASLPSEHIRRSQALILDLLKEQGPMTDERIYRFHRITAAMSPSGARTRRCELVVAGKVADSGKRERLPSGRMAVVWEAVK